MSTGEMAAFGASDAACYRWPGDTSEDRELRAAFCDGAAWAAEEIETLRAYAKHERSLGAEGPMIELNSAHQEIERLRAIIYNVALTIGAEDSAAFRQHIFGDSDPER